MATKSISPLDKSTKIQWIISFVVAIVIYVLPRNELYTDQIALFLSFTMFFILLLCFGLTDPWIPGLTLPLCYLVFNLAPSTTIFSAWGGILPFQAASAFFLAFMLEDSGLVRRLALLIISKMGGSYKGLCWGILFSGFVVSLISSCSLYVAMCVLVVGLCQALGFKKDIHSAGIFLAASLGTVSCEQFIWFPPAYAVHSANVTGADPSITMPWVNIILHCWPIAIYMIVFLWFALKFLIPEPDNFDAETIQEQVQNLGKMTLQEKKAAIFITIFITLLVVASFTGWNTNYMFMIVPFLCFLPGIRLADSTTVKKVPFNMVFVIGGFVGIGSVANYLGINTIIAEWMLPYFENLSTPMFLAGGYILGTLMNIILTPLAFWSVLGPTLAQFFIDMGINPLAITYILNCAGDALFLPHEHNSYLIMFGFGIISMRHFIKFWSIKLIFHFVGIMCILVPYWYLIGLV